MVPYGWLYPGLYFYPEDHEVPAPTTDHPVDFGVSTSAPVPELSARRVDK